MKKRTITLGFKKAEFGLFRDMFGKILWEGDGKRKSSAREPPRGVDFQG